MAMEMVRIDDRFIHGQVMVGWCPTIEPDRLILCDDEVAQSSLDREIYEDAAMEYKVTILTVADTARYIKDKSFKDEKVFLIVNSPQAVVKLIDLGADIKKVIVGGMHYEDGKRRVNDFIYINDEDLKNFRVLLDRRVSFYGQDVPTCKEFDVAKALGLKD